MRKETKSRNKIDSKKLAPPNYLIICEGKQTEPNYFEGLKRRLNQRYEDRINIVPYIKVKGTGMNTESLVKYAQKIVNQSYKMYGQVWVVFDKDEYSDEQFNNAIKLNEYNSAWSNPNFEVWILSHFRKLNKSMTKDETMKQVTKEFEKAGLGEYKKNDKELFTKISGEGKMEKAIKNCQEVYELMKDQTPASSNPATTVFMLVNDLKEYMK